MEDLISSYVFIISLMGYYPWKFNWILFLKNS